MVVKVAQYPQNADGTPMDLLVGVLTDASGNAGARLANCPRGPDGAPIDAVALVLVDEGGNIFELPRSASSIEVLAASPPQADTIYLYENGKEGNFKWTYGDFSSYVAIDTKKGIYVPSTADPSGVTGAWVRVFHGSAQLSWFGDDDDAFQVMYTLCASLNAPCAVTGTQLLLTRQHSLPEDTKLFVDNSVLYIDNNLLTSILKVSTPNVTVIGVNDGKLRGVIEFDAGMTNACILVQGSTNFRCTNLITEFGKYGMIALENDDLLVTGLEVRESARWGVTSGGNRNFEFRNSSVERTTGDSATDCWKIFGAGNGGWSARSSYDGHFQNCTGNDSIIGQSFDIISDTDSPDDLYNIVLTNCKGARCAGGFVEMKVSGNVTVAFSMHSIRINGGEYFGTGVEDAGIQVKERLYDIEIRDVAIHDCPIGFYTAGAIQQVQLIDCRAIRPRYQGFKLTTSSTSGGLGNMVINPIVIDPNWDQPASTNAGISVQSGTDWLIENPKVMSSKEPATNKHPYGLEILAGVLRTNISGTVFLQGHATAPINNLGTDTVWPEAIRLPEINLAVGAGSTSVGLGPQGGAFVACAVGVGYNIANNIGRTLTFWRRSTGSSTTILAYATDSAAAIYKVDRTDLPNGVRCPGTQTEYAVNLGAAGVYPGSPAGRVAPVIYGYRDAANLA